MFPSLDLKVGLFGGSRIVLKDTANFGQRLHVQMSDGNEQHPLVSVLKKHS